MLNELSIEFEILKISFEIIKNVPCDNSTIYQLMCG